MKTAAKKLITNNSGVAAIEMAIILPLLILLIVGGTELGIYMLRHTAAERALANITVNVQKDAGSVTQQDANEAGTVLANFQSAPNFFCAQSYATKAAAQAGSCVAGQWNVTNPSAIGGNYYVAFRTFIQARSFTRLMDDYINDIDKRSVIQVNPMTIPAGAVMAFNLAACPGGWSAYLPARGRNILGVGGTYVRGATGGEAKHTMTLPELVPHYHQYRMNKAKVDPNNNNNKEFFHTGAGTAYNTGMAVGAAATPFNVLDPYVVLLYCIKN